VENVSSAGTSVARTRTVTWEDPLEGAAAATSMSGLDYLRGIISGDIARPPLGELLGIRITSIDPGRAVFSLDTGEHLYNPFGGVHGGVLATVLDSALGCAVQSTLAAGVASTTVDLNVTFVRPATRDTGRLTCEAEIIHSGRKISTARGHVVDDERRIYATGTTTCLILGQPV
jgi:uncharacterized protein (TIGR00369 family)